MIARPAADDAETAAALSLRERVFCGEQGVSVAAERDGRDGDALHVVALDEDGAVVGTCRLLPEDGGVRLGRMAVEPAARGAGVGRAVLGAAEAAAAQAGARRVRLHAQLAVRALYARAGYRERGAPFDEEGIAHVAMEKELRP